MAPKVSEFSNDHAVEVISIWGRAPRGIPFFADGLPESAQVGLRWRMNLIAAGRCLWLT